MTAARSQDEILEEIIADTAGMIGVEQPGRTVRLELGIAPSRRDYDGDAGRDAIQAAGFGIAPNEDARFLGDAVREDVPFTIEAIGAAIRACDAAGRPHGVAPRGVSFARPRPRDAAELAAGFDHAQQRRTTEETVAELYRISPLEEGMVVTIDLHLDPALEAADPDGLSLALAAMGYRVDIIEGEDFDWIQASKDDQVFGVEAVLALEAEATPVALAHGFKPEGWGVPSPGLAGGGPLARAAAWALGKLMPQGRA